MLKELLAPYRGRDSLKIDDLVHQVAELVPRVAGPQSRYKVTAIPDARTVRFYIQEGLVDPPHGSSGPAALYGFRHLLQLVTVKVLQSHYLPIRKIKETIDNLTDEELEKLLDGWRSEPLAGGDPGESAVALLRGFMGESPPQPEYMPRAYLESFKTGGSDKTDVKYGQLQPAKGWTHYELYPGIELHVKEGIEISSSASFLSALSSRLRVVLENLKRSRP